MRHYRATSSFVAVLLSLAVAACSGGDTGSNGTNDSDTSVNATNAAPVVSIELPADGAVVAAGEALTLTGSVSDDSDAPDALQVVWTSSQRAAPIFEGRANSLGGTTVDAAGLAAGTHVITLGATDSGGKVGTARVTITVNQAPGAAEVTISPASPVTSDDLVASISRDAVDPNRASTALTYSYRWFKDGAFANVTQATVAAAQTKKGEAWEVRVTAHDGFGDGLEATATVTIGNSPPSCQSASIFPTAANTTKDISCLCTGWQDPDGDAADDRCAFLDGASPLPGDGACTLPASATDKGMDIHCVYTPSDGDDDGPAVSSGSVPILNAPPTAPEVALTPAAADALTELTCSLGAPSTDPDGDSLTYEVAWLLDGFENAGVTVSHVTPRDLVNGSGVYGRRGAAVRCRLTARDGQTSSAPATSAEVVLGNAPPAIDNVAVIPVGGAAPNENAVLRCQVSGTSDADGDGVTLSYVWYVGGVEVAGQTGQDLTGASFAKGDSVTCAAVADDGQGATSALEASKTSLTIGNALPTLLGAALDKTEVSAFGELTCIPEGWSDPDGDALEVAYAWFEVDGATLILIPGESGAKLTPDTLDTGDKVACQVTPKNGSELGAPVTSPAATIVPPAPSAPIVQVAAPDGASGAVRCDFVEPAQHFAGAISYTFYWALNGGAETTGSATISGLHDCDLAACRAAASDGTTTLSSNTSGMQLPVGDDCDTGDACKTPTCQAGGGCDFVLASDIACDDGNACTTGDRCELGFCVAGGFAGETAACEDGSFCTGGDRCNGAGGCVGGADPCTTGANSCLIGSCDELEDRCLAAPKTPGSACSDGNGCTVGDGCSANGVCLPGSAVDCSGEGDACNAGVCVSLGANDHTCDSEPRPSGAPCDSGDFCVVEASCDGAGSCAGGTERDCAAEVGDDCNTAYCDSDLGRCSKSPADPGTPCDDGDSCTLVDTCSNGYCVGSGDACVEEQLNASWAASQTPSIVPLGFGRYATQWWRADAPQVALRLSDARGSRENEEMVLASSGRPTEWHTRMAVRPGGDFGVPYWNNSPTAGCSYGSCCGCGSAGQCYSTYNGWVDGDAFDFAGTRKVSNHMIDANLQITACSGSAYVTINPTRMITLALGGDFGFVVSEDLTRTGTITARSNWLIPFVDDPASAASQATSKKIRFFPATGLMSVGTPVTLVDHTEINGVMWDARVTTDGSGTFLVAWVATGQTAIQVRRYQATGAPAAGSSNPWTVYTAGAGETIQAVRIVGMSDSKFVVAWDSAGPDGSGRGVYFRRYDGAGNALDAAPIRVNSATNGDQRLGDVDRFSDNGVVIAFDDQHGDSDGWSVKARLYAANGSPRGGVMDVNTNTAGSQYYPTVAVLETDEFVVAFIDNLGRVWTRRYLSDGTSSVGRIEWQLNATTEGGQKAVQGARGGNGMVLAVYESPVYGKPEGEILARLVNPTGPSVGPELQVNETEAGAQLLPAVSAGGGHFAVAWQSAEQDGSSEGIYLRFFDGAASPASDEVAVNVTTAGFQRNPAVASAASDGTTVVAWGGQNAAGGSIGDVYVRAFDVDGTPLGGELLANVETSGLQDFPAVAFGPDGAAVVAWQSAEQDGSGYGIYLRKLDANGVPSGDEVRVNTQVDLDQTGPSVAVAGGGDRMTVCWSSFGQDAQGSLGVYCQVMVYTSLAKLGAEVLVNAVKAGEQRNPAVAYLATGDIAVAWDSEGVDSDRFAVQVRKLTSLGLSNGPRVVANRSWSGTQESPALVPLSSTNVMALWEGSDHDGSGKGVYFRIISGL
ncbi:MAG: hypothetical protein CVU56_10535 [Deltaproteobacteria bacterium HGW-Deltaproteobacteria-14]|jgi:hypothetical protein|nr:MAG: hypothetical protein CVU56_10535 [Deltaproteobacteria bacterium HGW-Deltaproteobacteria-14]